MNTKIFIVGHKKINYGWYQDNALYQPIQVGEREDILPDVLRDNTGKNIHKWNPLYAELCATYWISNNVTGYTYLGQCQYRRRFKFPEDENFDKIFNDYDVVCCKPLNMPVYQQYCLCHSVKDMEDLEEAINAVAPEFNDAFDKYIRKGTKIYYSNSYILPAKQYKDYAKFLFKVLNYIKKKRGWTTVDKARNDMLTEMQNGERNKIAPAGRDYRDYQIQWAAFTAERIWTMWVQEKCPRRMEMNYSKYEGV